MAEKIKVMAVDDEPDIVKILRISLELANYDIVEAYSGEECHEQTALLCSTR